MVGVLTLCFCFFQLAVGPLVPLSEDADPNMTKRFIQLAEEGKLDLPEPWHGGTPIGDDAEQVRSRAQAFSAELSRPIRDEVQRRHKASLQKTVPLAAIGFICTTVALVLRIRRK